MKMHWNAQAMGLCGWLVIGCNGDNDPSGAPETSGEPATETTPDDTTTTNDPSTTDATESSSTAGATESSSTSVNPDTTTGDTDTDGDTETTGGPLACVDIDIGSAVGAAVAEGTTVGADDDLGNSCLDDKGKKGGGDGAEYVVQWQAPAAGVYTFSLEGSSYDTALAIFDGDCNGPELVCADDCFGLQSALTLEVAADQIVLVAIDGYAGKTGAFTLGIAVDAPPVCGGGDTDTVGTSVSGTDSGFEEDGGEPTTEG